MKNREDLKGDNSLTKTELDALKVLWKFGPSTVRFVHDKLNEEKKAVIYTSTLKLLQTMKEKGLVERDETKMKHVYKSLLAENKVKGGLVRRFIDSMFDGSTSGLMVALLEEKAITPDELKKMRNLLDKMDT